MSATSRAISGSSSARRTAWPARVAQVTRRPQPQLNWEARPDPARAASLMGVREVRAPRGLLPVEDAMPPKRGKQFWTWSENDSSPLTVSRPSAGGVGPSFQGFTVQDGNDTVTVANQPGALDRLER